MSFLSFSYLAFLAPLLAVYWWLPRRGQNALLLAASLLFCALWDVRFAALLVLSTLVDYRLGRALEWERPEASRQRALWASVVLDVGILAAFRGSGWFGAGAEALAGTLGWRLDPTTTGLVIPVGLSFYTLQRLSHTLDVYYRLLRPSSSLLDFALFVAFFPQLASGPIERARNVLPQLARRRTFDPTQAYEAAWLLGFGLFKKVFIADHCAEIADHLLDPTRAASGLGTALGIYAYAWQIYADFSGYSDLARGSGRLFGIELTQNFQAPYLSANLTEFWKRWHVSLSSWLEDYVYKPTAIGLRDYGTGGVVVATVVTFLLSGLWHGTAATFVVWGLIHAIGLIAFMLTRRWRRRWLSKVPSVVPIALTFHVVCLGWVFFRAPSLGAAFTTLASLAGPLSLPAEAGELLAYAGILGTMTYLQHHYRSVFWIFERPGWLRAAAYTGMAFCTLRLYATADKFIYFQF